MTAAPGPIKTLVPRVSACTAWSITGSETQQEQPRWQTEPNHAELDEPHLMTRAAQFRGDGPCFGTMDPGKRMRAPGFAENGDVQNYLPAEKGWLQDVFFYSASRTNRGVRRPERLFELGECLLRFVYFRLASINMNAITQGRCRVDPVVVSAPLDHVAAFRLLRAVVRRISISPAITIRSRSYRCDACAIHARAIFRDAENRSVRIGGEARANPPRLYPPKYPPVSRPSSDKHALMPLPI
jgi:hypothetical protein